jgi:hypothetical protein
MIALQPEGAEQLTTALDLDMELDGLEDGVPGLRPLGM